MDIEPYKSLRTTIFEVQTTAAVNVPWQTASGNWGANNKDGVVDYFDSEENAKAWLSGTHKPAGRLDPPGDISTKVDLDDDGYEKKETKKDVRKPSGSNGTSQATQTQTQADQTQHQAQQKGVRSSEQKTQVAVEKTAPSDVAAEKPKTELSKSIKPDPQATVARGGEVIKKQQKEGYVMKKLNISGAVRSIHESICLKEGAVKKALMDFFDNLPDAAVKEINKHLKYAQRGTDGKPVTIEGGDLFVDVIEGILKKHNVKPIFKGTMRDTAESVRDWWGAFH